MLFTLIAICGDNKMTIPCIGNANVSLTFLSSKKDKEIDTGCKADSLVFCGLSKSLRFQFFSCSKNENGTIFTCIKIVDSNTKL